MHGDTGGGTGAGLELADLAGLAMYFGAKRGVAAARAELALKNALTACACDCDGSRRGFSDVFRR